jgi:hypothetical protein
LYDTAHAHAPRGIAETDLTEYGAKFGDPKIFVLLVEWADKIITE